VKFWHHHGRRRPSSILKSGGGGSEIGRFDIKPDLFEGKGLGSNLNFLVKERRSEKKKRGETSLSRTI